jgi:phosphohistidine phosphatase SixA
MGVILAQSAAVETLLVVGHNPGLSELVLELEPRFEVDALPTCAVVGFDYASAGDGRQIADASPAVFYYDFPKNSRTPLMRR